MAKKQIIIDGTTYDLGAESQNVDYTNAGMPNVTNAESALNNLQERVGVIEDPTETTIYTEDATKAANGGKEGYYLTDNANEATNSSYNCSDYITIPVGAKMYIKANYALAYGILFFKKNTIGGSYSWMTGKNITTSAAYEDYTEVAIPDNATAFRFSYYHNNGTSNHISIKFVVSPAMEEVVKLKVGAWNMGHFGGGADQSTISDETVDEKRSAYRKVFDKVNADILCLSEFNELFNSDDSDSTPQEEILCNYPYFKIGGRDAYNLNAVFSKLPILQTREFKYTEWGAHRYIKETTLKIKGKVVKVIATHLDEENNGHTENKGLTQLQELISIYADDPYVIIGADFNIHITDRVGPYVSHEGGDGYLNYQILTNAGYTLLRFDYLDNGTLSNPMTTSTADNIAVKGFAMGKREFIYEEGVSETLSDHCMVACELVML